MFSRAPLLPVALAVTAGLVVDRWLAPPVLLWAVGLLFLCFTRLLARPTFASTQSEAVPLWLAAGCLAGAWHHFTTHPRPSDIGGTATHDGRLVRLRGRVASEIAIRAPEDPALVSQPEERRSVFLFTAESADAGGRWSPVSGTLRVTVGEAWHAGEVAARIELLGTLFAPPQAANPGAPSPRAFWEDRGIFGLVFVKNAAGIRRLDASGPTLAGTVAAARAWNRDAVSRAIPAPERQLAWALLLGDQSTLTSEQFEGFQRTGVFHVLAVSGQHLVVLCLGLVLILRLAGRTRRQQVGWQLAFIVAYTLLTGANPPVVRAAIMVAALGVGLWLRRPVEPLNSLSLAWLVIAIWSPSALFLPGVQLSFLAVGTLLLAVAPLWQQWQATETDPLAAVERQYQPLWRQMARLAAGWVGAAYFATALAWLATQPLLAARYHLVSPIAIIVGPPVALLMSLALILGMLLIVAAFFSEAISMGLGSLTAKLLRWSQDAVCWAESIPGGHLYVPDLPEAWLAASGMLLLFVVIRPAGIFTWKRWMVLAALWLAWGSLAALPTWPAGLRLTVLAVGHGSAAVAETADGRVLLFDAGSLAGPEVATWVIAPYLWYRGHTRIDEVILSHGDLDHFNGLPALLDRFRIGLVSTNPTFAEKTSPGVGTVLQRLREAGVPVRELHRGQTLQAGELTMNVLHPPRVGPAGTENARSLVLLLHWAKWSFLLPGDLEPPGLEQVVGQPSPGIDVLVAPHHGSPISNTELFATWANARLVVSSEGWPKGRRPDPYSLRRGILWRTFRVGAVTLLATEAGLEAKTFRTEEAWRSPP